MWIEIVTCGKRKLVNLNFIERITLVDEDNNYHLAYHFNNYDFGSLHEYFDTLEEAEARYEEIKRLLVGKLNVEDLLAKSEKEFRRK